MYRVTLPMAFAASQPLRMGGPPAEMGGGGGVDRFVEVTTLPGLGVVRDGTGSQPPLLRLTNLETGRNWDFRQTTLPIGRGLMALEADDARNLSRRHAGLVLREGQIFITDESSYGTFVNHQRLPQGGAVEIFPGDMIRFGPDPSLTVYLVNLPESDKTPLPLDHPSIFRDARERLKARLAEQDQKWETLSTFASGREMLAETKRREVLDFLLDPSEPFYSQLPPQAACSARLYDAYFYLQTFRNRCGSAMQLTASLHLQTNGQPILIHKTRRQGQVEEDIYVSDPEAGVVAAWLSRRSPILTAPQRSEYAMVASTTPVSPATIRKRIENETGKYYFPCPIAFVDLEDLFLPPTPPQSAGT